MLAKLLGLLPIVGALRVPTALKVRSHRSSVMMETAGMAILFDCDGVLADTERDGHRVSFNRAFQEKGLGFEWGVEEYGRLCEVGGGKERVTFYCNKNGWPAGYEEATTTELSKGLPVDASRLALVKVARSVFHLTQ